MHSVRSAASRLRWEPPGMLSDVDLAMEGVAVGQVISGAQVVVPGCGLSVGSAHHRQHTDNNCGNGVRSRMAFGGCGTSLGLDGAKPCHHTVRNDHSQEVTLARITFRTTFCARPESAPGPLG